MDRRRRLEPCHESRIIGTGDSNSNRNQIDPSVALKIAQNLKILRDIVAKQRNASNFEVCSNTDFGEEVEEESNEESQQIEFRKRFNTFLNKSKQQPKNQQTFHENNCDKFSSNWIDESESNFQIEDSQDDDIDKIRIYYDLPLLLNCLQFSNQNQNCPKFLIENSNSSSSISRTNQKLIENSRRRQTSNSSNSTHKTASNEVTRPTSSSVAFTRKVVELRNIYNSDSDEFAKFNDDNDDDNDYLDLDQDVDIVLEDDPEDTDIDDPYGPCDSEDLNRIRPDPCRSDNYQVPLRNRSSSIHQTMPKRIGKISESQLPNSQKRLTTSIEIADSGSWNHRPTKLAANKTCVTSIPKITLPPSSSSSSSSFSSLASQSASPPPYSPSSLASSSSSSSSLSLSPPSLQSSSSQPSSSSKQNSNQIPAARTIEPTIPNINGEIEYSNRRRPSCSQHSSARNYDRQVIKRWIVEKRRVRSEQILAEQLRKQLEKEKIAENCRKLLEKIRHRSNIAKMDNRPQMAPPPSTQPNLKPSSLDSEEISNFPTSNDVDSAPNCIIDYPDHPQYSSASSSSYPSSNPPSFNCQKSSSSSFPSNHNDIISDEDFSSLIQDFEEEEVYKKLPIISTKISPNSEETPPTPVVRAQQKSRVLRMLAGSLAAKENFGKKITEKFENQQILNEILCRSQEEEEFANFEKENSFLQLTDSISDFSKFVKSNNPETSTNLISVDETKDEDPIESSLEDSKISDPLLLNGSSVSEIPEIEESPIPNWNQLCHRVFQSKSVIEKTSQTSSSSSSTSPPPPIDLIQFLSAKSSSLSPIIDYFTTQPSTAHRFRCSNIDSCQILEDSQSSPQSQQSNYPNHQEQQQQQQSIQQPLQHQTAPFPPQFEDIQQINVKQFIVEQSSRIFNLYRVAQNQRQLSFEQLIRNLKFSSSSSSSSSSSYRQFLFDLCKEIVLNHFDIQTIDVDPSSKSPSMKQQQEPATSVTLLLPLQMQKQPFPRDNLEKFTQQIWLHVSRILPSQLPSEATIATSDEILRTNRENNDNSMESENCPNYNYNNGKKSKLKRFGLMAYCRMQRKLDFVDSVLYREMLQDEQRWSGYFEPEIEEIKRQQQEQELQQQRESGNSRI